MVNMIRLGLILVVLGFMVARPSFAALVGSVVQDDDLARLQKNILAELTPQGPLAPVDIEVESIASTLSVNGSWPDVNYDDANDRSWWYTAEHLRRSLLMVTYVSMSDVCRASQHVKVTPLTVFVLLVTLFRAVHAPESRFYRSAVMLEQSERAIFFWISNDFQNSNWWWNQIGTPRYL
jgi:hypothetical protein